ncbi:unnamed protein product, partial [Ceratitis capitata]
AKAECEVADLGAPCCVLTPFKVTLWQCPDSDAIQQQQRKTKTIQQKQRKHQ